MQVVVCHANSPIYDLWTFNPSFEFADGGVEDDAPAFRIDAGHDGPRGSQGVDFPDAAALHPDLRTVIVDGAEVTIFTPGAFDGFTQLRHAVAIELGLGLAFAGFALFWMVLAASAGGFFWAFGLIHFSVGIGISFGALFWSAYRRRNTWYTLTNKRAFVASELPLKGRKLKSYPITETTVLEFDNATPATIHFAEETRRGQNGTSQVKIGFERIADGSTVYRLIRDVQKGAA